MFRIVLLYNDRLYQPHIFNISSVKGMPVYDIGNHFDTYFNGRYFENKRRVLEAILNGY